MQNAQCQMKPSQKKLLTLFLLPRTDIWQPINIQPHFQKKLDCFVKSKKTNQRIFLKIQLQWFNDHFNATFLLLCLIKHAHKHLFAHFKCDPCNTCKQKLEKVFSEFTLEAWLHILAFFHMHRHIIAHFLTCIAHRKSRRSLRSSCLEWRARALTKSNRDRMGS